MAGFQDISISSSQVGHAMKCKACNADMSENSVFCPECGERHESDTSHKPVAETPASSTTDKLRSALKERQSEEVSDEVLWEGGYSAKGMIGSWILGTLISVILVLVAVLMGPLFWIPLIALLLLWAGLGLTLAYYKLGVAYSLTSQRFQHRAGILRQVTDRIETIDIDDVSFEQGLMQRMVGVGTIRIVSSDRSHPDLALHAIDRVHYVAELIDSTRRSERRRRGVHIEAI
jgi:membrane protein YdbS with pleckstrin-like domain